MNNKHSICASLLSLFVSLPAFSDVGNIYGTGKIGWSWENLTSVSDSSTGVPPVSTSANAGVLAYGGAVGFRWNTFLIPIRMEVDYTYRNNLSYNTDLVGGLATQLKSTVQSQTILGNLYIDIPVVDMFSVFLGGGGGLAYNTTNNKFIEAPITDKSTTYRDAGAWMATAGVSVIPLEWLAIDLSYRYSGLGSVRWTGVGVGEELNSTNFTAQEVFLGFRFTVPSEKRAEPRPLPYRPKEEPVAAPVIKGAPYHKPQTKGAPYHKPETKGASYKGATHKGASYEGYEPKGPSKAKNNSYDSSRAQRVTRRGSNS
jgi:opacity protein-like surface antigen